MARLPSYRRHKARGQACTKIRGRIDYLGPFGSAESTALRHNILHFCVRELGYIDDPKSKTKSVLLTLQGMRRSRELFDELFAKRDRTK